MKLLLVITFIVKTFARIKLEAHFEMQFFGNIGIDLVYFCMTHTSSSKYSCALLRRTLIIGKLCHVKLIKKSHSAVSTICAC